MEEMSVDISSEITTAEIQQLYTSVKLKYDKLPDILKSEQMEGIHAILNRKDLLLLLPTNYGKSLVFTVPGILHSELRNAMTFTLIVSPLTSLIRDGMERLRTMGLFSFHCVVSSVKDGTLQGFVEESRSMSEARFIFVSPEVLKLKYAKEFFYELSPFFVAVDEGHLASEWGKDFRKDYAVLYELRSHVECPLGVFTATLTPDILLDVKRKTGLNSSNLVTISVFPDRPNVYLQLNDPSKNLSAFDVLVDDVRKNKNEAEKVIVFVTTVQATADIFLWFENKLGENMVHEADGVTMGYYVNYYSACTEPEAKNEILEEFSKENGYLRVLICTIAFGMGVNIPNVRRVYIWGMPTSIMTLWQEIGRAGRDELKSYAYIYPFRTGSACVGQDQIKFPENSCIRNFILSHFVGGQINSAVSVEQKEDSEIICKGCCCCSACPHTCTVPVQSGTTPDLVAPTPTSVMDLLLLK